MATAEEKKKYMDEHQVRLDETYTRAAAALMKNKTTVFMSTSVLKNIPQFVAMDGLDTAAATGKDIIIDPMFWLKLKEEQRMRVLFHEGFHNLMGHCDVRINSETDRIAWNIAADCVVEAMANECSIGEGNYLPGCITPTYGGNVELKVNGKKLIISRCQEKYVEEIYKLLLDHAKKNPAPNGGMSVTDMNGKPINGMDKHELRESTEQERSEREQELRQALVEHKLKGTMPGALADMIEKRLQGKVNWKAELRDMIVPEIKSYQTFSKHNRRAQALGLHMPGMAKEGVQVTFAIDTSGSIGTTEIEYYLGEIQNLFQQFEPGMVTAQLMFHHTMVYRTYDIHDVSDLENIRTESGGTSHKDVFTKAEELDSKVLICLTDGYSDFPENTKVGKVLWIVTNKDGATQIPAGLGKVIIVPVEELTN